MIDLYLNRGYRRGRGDFYLPQDLEELLCIYFLCRKRKQNDLTGMHIRRCQELPPSCLERLRDRFGAVIFGDLVRTLATYCELQNEWPDDHLEEFMARLCFDYAVVTTLKGQMDYENLLKCGTVHPPKMAQLLSRIAGLYEKSPEVRELKEGKGWRQKAKESLRNWTHSRNFQ